MPELLITVIGVLSFPVVLLVAVALLARLESWVLAPDERADAVVRILEQVDRAEAVEVAVAEVLAPAVLRRRRVA